MIIITDILKAPFDEGAKNAAFNLIQAYKKKYPSEILTINSNHKFPFKITNFLLNKLLFNLKFYYQVKLFSYKTILYIPSASTTPLTYLRAKLLKIFTYKNIIILSLQPREYNSIEKKIISKIYPHKVITQSTGSAKKLNSIGIKTNILPLGVDIKKFIDCSKIQKKHLRQKYNLCQDAKILLHVGHIKKKRNIEWLIEVKKSIPKLDIVIIGSTTTVQEKEIRRILTEKGIIVLRQYVSKIEEIYQLADYYVFPVQKENGSIETPLSVLEAMATNLQILTTRFGSLPETFREDEHFRFINNPQDIVFAVENGFTSGCNNRLKIMPFMWGKIADRLHEMV